MLAVAAGLLASSAAAEVYKCTDSRGRTSYSDSPCPAGSVTAVDVTTAVQACTTEACEAQRARDVADARRRLQEDKQALSEMSAQRRRAETEYLEQRAKLEQLKAQQAAAERYARAETDPYAGDRWGYGWGVPIYPARPILRPPQPSPWPVPHPHAQPRLDPLYTSRPVPILVK
jgi:hypothetical protein